MEEGKGPVQTNCLSRRSICELRRKDHSSIREPPIGPRSSDVPLTSDFSPEQSIPSSGLRKCCWNICIFQSSRTTSPLSWAESHTDPGQPGELVVYLVGLTTRLDPRGLGSDPRLRQDLISIANGLPTEITLVTVWIFSAPTVREGSSIGAPGQLFGDLLLQP